MTAQPSHRPPFRFDSRGPLPTLIVGAGDDNHYDAGAGTYDNRYRLAWLHGLGWSPPASLALMSLVANAFGVTIYAPWLPNHGAAPNVCSYPEYAARLNLWAKYYGLRDITWVGHSIGGYTATELAIRYPELASGVVAFAAPLLKPYHRRPVPLLRTKIAALHLEAVGITTCALAAEYLNGYGHLMRTALLDLGRPPTRYGQAVQVIQTSPVLDRLQLEGLGARLNGRFVTVYGGADAIVRRPRRPLSGSTVLSIPLVGHSFVALSGRRTAAVVIRAVSLARGAAGSLAHPVEPAGLTAAHPPTGFPAAPAA
jgi:pimeloyl-ACP methyl ester carboxylesterase